MLLPSQHEDTFARDRLPSEDLWPTMEFELPGLDFPDRMNAAHDLLDGAIERHGPDRPALRTPEGEVWTYGELQSRVAQLAHHLRDRCGVRPGQRVLLRSPNNPRLVTAWLAVLKVGGVVVTTMPVLRAGEVATLVERTRPSVALVDHRFVEDLDAALARTDQNVVRLLMGGGSPDDVFVQCAGEPEEFEAVLLSSDDVALLCPTSGTTGVPKVTMHFHRDILAIDRTYGEPGAPPRARRRRRVHRAAGLHLRARRFGRVHARRRGVGAADGGRHPAGPGRAGAEHGVTVLFTAPTAYRAIVQSGRIEMLRGLRRAVSAGEHMPRATWEALRDGIGLRCSTASAPPRCCTSSSPPGWARSAPGSTGTPVPGYRAKIIDEDGNEQPPGEPGRLAVIGPDRLPLPRRPAPARLRRRRLEPHRRHLPPRRGGAVPLRRPQRRDDRLLGLQHRRPRGRGSPDAARVGRRVRRGRPARCDPRSGGLRVRRTRRGGQGGRRVWPRTSRTSSSTPSRRTSTRVTSAS